MGVMQKIRETLADFVSRVMKEKKLSHRKVAAASGGLVSHSSVADIANGHRHNPNKDTILGLSKGLDVPADDLFRVARGQSVDLKDRFEIYAERFDAHDIVESEWQFLEAYFKDYVDSFRAGKKEREANIRKMIEGDLKTPADKIVAHIGSPKTEGKKAA